MAEPSLAPPTSTFVVRLWYERSAAGSRWRGWIEHVQSGQRVGFQDPDKMIAFIHSFGAFVTDDSDQDAASASRRTSRTKR